MLRAVDRASSFGSAITIFTPQRGWRLAPARSGRKRRKYNNGPRADGRGGRAWSCGKGTGEGRATWSRNFSRRCIATCAGRLSFFFPVHQRAAAVQRAERICRERGGDEDEGLNVRERESEKFGGDSLFLQGG